MTQPMLRALFYIGALYDGILGVAFMFVPASVFAGLPITRQDSRSLIEPSIGLRSTQPIETLLTEPRRSSVTFAPTVWPK